MQRISSFHSPAEAQRECPNLFHTQQFGKELNWEVFLSLMGSQQLWKQVTVPKTEGLWFAPPGIWYQLSRICIPWGFTQREPGRAVVTWRAPGACDRDSSGTADTKMQLPGNPGAAPAVGLAPNHPSVPVSPSLPNKSTGGDGHKSLPQPSKGRRRQSQSLCWELPPQYSFTASVSNWEFPPAQKRTEGKKKNK